MVPVRENLISSFLSEETRGRALAALTIKAPSIFKVVLSESRVRTHTVLVKKQGNITLILLRSVLIISE